MPRGAIRLSLPVSPGGVREDVNIAAVPEGAFIASSNFLTRLGHGRPRPGYSQVGSALSSADRIIGFGFRGSPLTATSLVVHTVSAAYSYDGTSFTDITGTWALSDPEERVRFSTLRTGGILYLARVNKANAVDIWDGTAAPFTDPTDPVPAALDICTCANRLIVVNTTDITDNPYQVRWSDFGDINTWPTGASNSAELSDTVDAIVACAALGPNSFAIYKEDTLWVGQLQGANVAFNFQMVDFAPGPVSPSVVVPYLGYHYWLGRDGSIYRFDGTRYDKIASGLAITFGSTFEWTTRFRAHGFVMALPEPEIWWVYPEIGTNELTRAVCLNLITGALTPHTFATEVTASGQWLAQASLTWDSLTGFTWDTLAATYPTWDSMTSSTIPTGVLGHVDGTVSQFGNVATDDGEPIPWSFTQGYKIPADKQRFLVDGVMYYWHREDTSLPVDITVTATDSLGDQEPGLTRIYDLATDDNHYVPFGDMRGTFFKVQNAGASSATTLSCRGGALLGWARGLV